VSLVQARPAGLSTVRACAGLRVSRATHYRARAPHPRLQKTRCKRHVPRALCAAERQHILATLHSAEFVDQPPTEVYATLLDRGIFLGSIRTFYRILEASGENKERRNQRKPHVYAKPELVATAPNQVWTWDITKLATNEKGVFLMAYVIIDLFSRLVVGWMVASKECQHLAVQLFTDSIARHGVEPGLIVHADRGAAMKSDTLAQLLDTLGVSRSFNRPRVSNDNPFSESHFKTLKYQPDYPGKFACILAARAWLQEFFAWYNDVHHHTGLALFTPAEVFCGRVTALAKARQGALDSAYALTPERFPNGPPRVALPARAVHINPTESSVIMVTPKPAEKPVQVGKAVAIAS
jgi:putative transposase